LLQNEAVLSFGASIQFADDHILYDPDAHQKGYGKNNKPIVIIHVT
jgi:hypothetical protein